MFYMETAGHKKLIVVGDLDLEQLKRGVPAASSDKSVVLIYAPDVAWLRDRLKECGGNTDRILAVVEEALKRPRATPAGAAS